MRTARLLNPLCACMLALGLLLPAHAAARTEEAAEDQAVQLAVAYQSGFLSVTAMACFQLYSSMGIIATDLGNGHITGMTALGALEQNALLLGVCQGSLEDVRQLTASSDTQGLELLDRIGGMLTALGGLHTALVDAASAPRGDAKQREAAEIAVNEARTAVEAALDAYAAPLAAMP